MRKLENGKKIIVIRCGCNKIFKKSAKKTPNNATIIFDVVVLKWLEAFMGYNSVVTL